MKDIKSSFLVVSRVMSEGKLKGFLVVDSSGSSEVLHIDAVPTIAPKIDFINAEYDSQFKTLVGIHGQSLTDCPEINENFELTSRNGISVFCIVKDKDTKDLIGVVAYNGMGSHFNLTFNKLDELSRKNKSCNFEMFVDSKYGLICKQKDGTPFECVEMISKKKVVQKKVGCVEQKNNEVIPMITSYDMKAISNDEFSASCQQKFVKAALSLKKLTPYYFTIYSTIRRMPAPIETMGVTEDTLYYGNKFVAESSVEELVFVLIHEIMHIMMQHSLRFKPRTNHDLWNIACDLYINTLICNDFGCKFGGGVESIYVADGTKIEIKTPDYGVFESTFGKTIDFKLDTPETIYNEMLKNAQQSGQGSNSQNSSNQGKGQGNDVFDDGAGEGSDGTSQKKTVSVTYNGKTVNVTINKDVMSNNNSQSQGVEKDNLEASRKALQRAKTKIELEEQDRGESLTKNAGSDCGLTQRYIEVGLASGVDWRILLKNLCKDKPKKTFTLSQPNVDYMNLGMTLADRRAIGKPTHISHVKFAIDVSGSVSTQELNAALSEINQIYKHFKIDGELIYWSTMIGDVGNFSNLKDMLKVQPVSDGGTDARCIFDYLSGKTKVHGRYESDKPRDITAIFIITDGYFRFNFDEYAQMFGKKVVWLITGVKGNLISFDPPFGRAIHLSLD